MKTPNSFTGIIIGILLASVCGCVCARSTDESIGMLMTKINNFIAYEIDPILSIPDNEIPFTVNQKMVQQAKNLESEASAIFVGELKAHKVLPSEGCRPHIIASAIGSLSLTLSEVLVCRRQSCSAYETALYRDTLKSEIDEINSLTWECGRP